MSGRIKPHSWVIEYRLFGFQKELGQWGHLFAKGKPVDLEEAVRRLVKDVAMDKANFFSYSPDQEYDGEWRLRNIITNEIIPGEALGI